MDLDIANILTLHHACHFHCDHQDHHIFSSPTSSPTTSVVNRLTLYCWFLLLAFVPTVLNTYKVYLYIYISIYLYSYKSIYLYIYISIYLYIYISIYIMCLTIFPSIWQARLWFWIPWCASKVVILFGWGTVGCCLVKLQWNQGWIPKHWARVFCLECGTLDFSSQMIPKKKLKTLKPVVSFFFPRPEFWCSFFLHSQEKLLSTRGSNDS